MTDRHTRAPRESKPSRNTIMLKNFDDVSKAVTSARGALKVIGVLLAVFGSSSVALGSYIVTTTLQNEAAIVQLETDVGRVESSLHEHATDDDHHDIEGLRDEMRRLTSQLTVANTELKGSLNTVTAQLNRLDRDIDRMQRTTRAAARRN